jgi:L-2,4-diaminobutyrate decarboxylase
MEHSPVPDNTNSVLAEVASADSSPLQDLPAVPTAMSLVSTRGDGSDLADLVADALSLLATRERRHGPVPPGGPAAAHAFAVTALGDTILPDVGIGAADSLQRLGSAYVRWAVDISHPATAARMQCPPATVAVAADLLVSALNQSLHAWEAGPFALELERQVISDLAGLAGYGPEAGGTITAGGSVSNIMSVLAARDDAYERRFGKSAFQGGAAGVDARPVVLCTETVHFSADRGASIAGIGAEGIIRVPADERGCMIPAAADQILRELPPDHLPIMLFVCAGSTDFGWVDPLPELAEIARKHGIWLHADAAYGGGALFSSTLRPLFAGIEAADSITLDLHKFGWTPASSGIFLVRDATRLRHLASQQTSLNAPDDVAEGFIGRYGASIQATRRCDAMKIAATLLAYGKSGLGQMVDACHHLARYAAARVRQEDRLELAAEPVISTVLFRYRPATDTDIDDFNSRLRRRLMTSGRAMLARVSLPDTDGRRRTFLKLMLLNPATTTADIDEVIDLVLGTAAEMDQNQPL